MANDYFRFKHFIIYQDRCFFKVNTDSCLFGAVAGHPNPERILDIGSGTGLLALMMAQRFPEARIDAVEIDPDSAKQAEQNFKLSNWYRRIKIHNLSIQDYTGTAPDPYDLVLANPPWFINQQKSPDTMKNLGRHGSQFLVEELSRCAAKLTGAAGIFYTIFSMETAKGFTPYMELAGFHALRRILIRSDKNQQPSRIITGYSRRKLKLTVDEIIIHEGRGQYSMEFRSLLRDFYQAF